jgi:hypothetical protein
MAAHILPHFLSHPKVRLPTAVLISSGLCSSSQNAISYSPGDTASLRLARVLKRLDIDSLDVVRNGFLLRDDLHTDFDTGHYSIVPVGDSF